MDKKSYMSATKTVELTPENVEAIHRGLKALDESYYQAGRGRGFCMVDWKFGRSLARSARLTDKQAHAGRWLIYKHRRQLPDDLLREAGV